MSATSGTKPSEVSIPVRGQDGPFRTTYDLNSLKVSQFNTLAQQGCHFLAADGMDLRAAHMDHPTMLHRRRKRSLGNPSGHHPDSGMRRDDLALVLVCHFPPFIRVLGPSPHASAMGPAEAICLHVLPAGLLLETPAVVRGVTCLEDFLARREEPDRHDPAGRHGSRRRGLGRLCSLWRDGRARLEARSGGGWRRIRLAGPLSGFYRSCRSRGLRGIRRRFERPLRGWSCGRGRWGPCRPANAFGIGDESNQTRSPRRRSA